MQRLYHGAGTRISSPAKHCSAPVGSALGVHMTVMDDGNAARGMDAVAAPVLRSIRPSLAKKKSPDTFSAAGLFYSV